jgi:hypothetical protein
MHPSCLEPKIPSAGRGRLTPITKGKLEMALPVSHKDPHGTIADQINSKLVAKVDGRPKTVRHLVRWARAWL